MEIVEIILKVLLAIASLILIPYIKQKLSKAQLDKLTSWVEIAVRAAEEAAHSGLIDKEGKYGYAVEFLQKNGIDASAEELRALVDSACWELFNQFKEK